MNKKPQNTEQLRLRASLSRLEEALVRLDTAREIIRAVIPSDIDRAVLFAGEEAARTEQVH
jgi:hypothetical protein